MELAVLIGVLAAVFVGGALQRISGMGLGLVVAPSATVLLGPVAGVTISNIAAIVGALLILGALRHDVDWRRYLRLAPLIAVGSVLGAFAVSAIRIAWLDIVVGSLVLLALGGLLAMRRATRLSIPGLGSGAGLAAGFMNTTSGVAAPAMTAYALATRWEQRSFAATLQPIFLTANVLALGTKLAFGTATGGAIDVTWWLVPALAAAAAVAVGVGTWLARYISAVTARRIAIAIALIGAVAALVRGILGV